MARRRGSGVSLFSRNKLSKRGLSDAGSIRVEGIEDTLRILGTLEAKIRRRVVTAAVRAGGKELLTRARAGAPRRTGALAKQLRQRVRFDRKSGTVTTRIWPKPTKSQRKKGHSHRGSVVHLVVEGTKAHKIRGPVSFNGRTFSQVDHPGSRPNPFIDRAAKSGQAASVALFTRRFASKLQEEIAKVSV